LWGSLRLAAEMRRTGDRGSIVTLLCDSGERYGNTYYDDAWLRTSGIDITPYTRTLETFATTGRWQEPN
jgi:cysteine synthase A